MKAKTLVACALTAAALPLAPALAQNAEPSGPQGTGSYGARSGAVPAPQVVAPADPYVKSAPQTARPADPYSTARVPQDARQPVRGRGSYDGPSWETNPPAPPA
jgi:hypothetical protein